MALRRSVPLSVLAALLGCFAGASVGLAAPAPFDFATLSGKAAVDAFLRAHAGEAYEDAVLGDFRVVDLDGDGRVELVISADFSGRRFFNHLIVFRAEGDRLVSQDVEVWNLESLEGAIQDLDQDGRREILVRRDLTPYLGVHPLAAWTAVLRYDGGRLIDQSARFPRFYDERVLPELDRRLAASDTTDRSDPYGKEVLTIERDKILRALGRSSSAGLDDALGWARSDDPIRRILALAVLSGIGGREAASALQALAADRDAQVAAHALVATGRRDSGGMNP